MKFVYQYRTPDNEQRAGSISAASRDDVYAELKRQGIRPSKVVLAPGLSNRIASLGKRGLAILVLGALCLALGVVVVGRVVLNAPQPSAVEESLDSQVRRQPIGDAAIIEQGIRTGWADVFELEGDRFLASFAIPGVPAGQRSTTEEEIKKALNCPPPPSTSTLSLEARQIRAMVSGMKAELREFLADGGTIAEYGRELVRRQEEELGYYNRTKNEIDAAVAAGKSAEEIEALWEARNDKLRRMGIKLVPMPE